MDRTDDPTQALLWALEGYMYTQVLGVAAVLRLPELTARPATLDELTRATGASREGLRRLLNALVALRVCAREADGSYTRGEVGSVLAGEPAIEALALLGRSEYYAAWGRLLDAVNTNSAVFSSAYGTQFWEYLAAHPDAAAAFSTCMHQNTDRIMEHCESRPEFSEARTFVDIGGSDGYFAAKLLGLYPKLSGVVFDLPVVEESFERHRDACHGLDGRLAFQAGDFLRAVPAGADVYTLKAILHDWPDDEATRILSNCVAVMGRSKLLVFENVASEEALNSGRLALQDLDMLILSGGRERSHEDFLRLFRDSGLRIVQAVRRNPASSFTVFVLERG